MLQKKQYKKLDKVFDSNKKEEKIKGIRANSNQVYSKYLSFYNYTTLLILLNVPLSQTKRFK